MGSLSDNGGWPPSDGGRPDRLNDLPSEWGDIVIPDDLSALSAEVAAVQSELHRPASRTLWQRLTRRGTPHARPRAGGTGFHSPALIIAMAVVVTVASLAASTWPGPARSPSSRTASSGDTRNLPALTLVDPEGQDVPLRAQLPAVILLIDGCDCDRLIADTTAAVRPEIAVITVSGPAAVPAGPTVAPAPARGTATPDPAATADLALPSDAGWPTVFELRDPADQLRTTFDLPAPQGDAAVLVVSRTGQIVRTAPHTDTVDDIRSDLQRI
ncbi:MAG TPA: hypothetical protein VFO77_01005 [Actinoplanes sp.]|nr:hypothetical protein [Actinoplanes sp.]